MIGAGNSNKKKKVSRQRSISPKQKEFKKIATALNDNQSAQLLQLDIALGNG